MRVYIRGLIYYNVILYLATIVGEQKSQAHIIMHQATIDPQNSWPTSDRNNVTCLMAHILQLLQLALVQAA